MHDFRKATAPEPVPANFMRKAPKTAKNAGAEQNNKQTYAKKAEN